MSKKNIDKEQYSNNIYSLPFHEAIHAKPIDWIKILKKSGFTGNLIYASELMMVISRGTKYAFEKLLKNKKIDSNTPLPKMGFTNIAPDGYKVWYELKDFSIIASTKYLQKISNFQLEDDITLSHSTTKEIRFEGKLEELFFLIGVEEFVHATDPDIDHSDHSQKTLSPDADVTIYTSQDHEYKAHGWKIRAAIDNAFSPKSIQSQINVLKKTIKHRAN